MGVHLGFALPWVEVLGLALLLVDDLLVPSTWREVARLAPGRASLASTWLVVDDQLWSELLPRIFEGCRFWLKIPRM